ncbi:MAG: hypothetical protein K6A38_01520 [Lachnospiraceae bacterium]|nr:hypothetical protein [Lachnospiraceae bacterium]
MNNKVLYYICKVLNWITPIGLFFLGMEAVYKAPDGTFVKTMNQVTLFGQLDVSVFVVVFFTYFFFWLVRIWAFRSGTDRIAYEVVVFLGMIASIAVAFFAPKTQELYVDGQEVECKKWIIWVIGVVVLAVLILYARVVTMIGSTEKYEAKSDSRKRRSLEYDVRKKQKWVEDDVRREDHAGKKRDEMYLDEAVRKRDRYYDSKFK